ncbi:septation ring formation regulator EzrA [uncultured Faecalicoccus sp.]|uniref:septation ring formation regulator EzrA n=1 Tax=uncultured Faecalicoccus sp. TaxID=1971760 RepID=UPI0025DBE1AF|nr:septation ring formation regulator EzrA [uncultured Faecalicoccus sp.]
MDAVMNVLNSMLSFINSHISTTVMIYMAVAILLLILIWILTRMIRRRKADKRLSELEVEVNEIRNNSLAFKFNKASAFARVNDDVMERVKNLTSKYNTCQQSVSTIEDLFTDADNLLDSRRTKKAMRKMDEIESLLDDTKERIRIVNQSLDHILQKESEIREMASAVKERFRSIKTVYQDNRSSFYGASAIVDARMEEIENQFTNFEEWMYASEFNKAQDESDKIRKQVETLSSVVAAYPGLYEKAKTIIPRAIEEVSTNIKETEDAGIDLAYLDPQARLDEFNGKIEEAIAHLDQGEISQADEILNSITDSILVLQDDINQEKSAFEEIHGDLSEKLSILDQIEEELLEIKNLYANIKDRFGLEDWTQHFRLADEQCARLKEKRELVLKQLDTDDRPSTELVHNYRDFVTESDEFEKQIQSMKRMLVGASSDESRAKKQLIKLQLILNEVRLNAAMRQLPSISGQFDEDIKEGERLIQRVRVVLDHSPLDVQTLNADLQDAIDFIYKLYNNANNLTGVAVMVENAIVFGNRFRSSHPVMDTELTKAELYYQNGEYTKALKVAIQAIENMHPGIYEKLVSRKDPAVMNQVQ